MPPPKQINEFMVKLLEDLKSKGIADTTANMYLTNLLTLNNKKPFSNLSFLKHKDQILSALTPYAESTRRTFLAGIVSVLSLFKDKPTFGKVYKDYQEILNEKSREAEAEPKNVRTKKQEDNWIDLEDILKIKNEYADAVKSLSTRKQATIEERNKLLDFLVLSLYTEIPPRRNQDYAVMYVVKKWSPSLPDDRNYYSLEDHKLIFQKYKTAKTYGLNDIDISTNEPLIHAINLYLKHHPLKPAKMGKSTMFPLLVKPDGSPLSPVNGITRLLNKIFKKNVGSSMLRHIYLTGKYGDVLEEMEKDSAVMSHSLSQQKDYIKNGDKDDDKKEDKETIEKVLKEIESS
jgi:hypothetical protein